MNNQKKILLLLLLVAVLHNISARSSFGVPLWQLQFPEPPQSQQQEEPQPRLLASVNAGGYEDELQQLLLLSSGLSPAQLLQRYQPHTQDVTHGRFLGHFPGKSGNGGTTVFVVSGPMTPPANVTTVNNNVNSLNNTASPPADAAGTGTRFGQFIRSPIGYPASSLPMQYFRTRQDEASSQLPYAGYGWNEAALYGAGLDGGLTGGLSPHVFGAGMPLVPITIGNEVRYVPLNLRMFRQLASMPLPLPVRENDEERPTNDEQLSLALTDEAEEPEDPIETLATGQTPTEGFARLGQRLRQRPLMRRNPLQNFAQNIRRVQYL
ncbi:uncharacterized protein LOC117590295 [Drosophila guanche]|uniref:Uncharacterized protein n=1 Tax=Drosophila guanche TaxID=7266 RepID=A0A3B0KPG1_DROGU|nr:uncharacterized protein LOC117590295 [Drosophila guanche]SPP88509.1 Hypothetical predicted protein [Drosophila guanche]